MNEWTTHQLFKQMSIIILLSNRCSAHLVLSCVLILFVSQMNTAFMKGVTSKYIYGKGKLFVGLHDNVVPETHSC